MFSHALILYQNTLINFWEKTSKTMTHVNNGFKGYQQYEFTYIKELAKTSDEKNDKKEKDAASFPVEKNDDLCLIGSDQKDNKDTEGTENKNRQNNEILNNGSLHNLLNLEDVSLLNLDEAPAPLLDESDEILMKIDSELEDLDLQQPEGDMLDVLGDGGASGGVDRLMDCDLSQDDSALLLDQLVSDNPSSFTADWEAAFNQ